MEDKITLDRKVFRSLASDTKISILKSIDDRRKTLSELSDELGMSVSTIKEHLDGLVKSGLIEQKDDGHKWKYYELTKTGNEILHPGSKKIWLILAASFLSMAGIVYDLARPMNSILQREAGSYGSSVETDILLKGAPNAMDAASSLVESMPVSPPMPEAIPYLVPWAHLALIALIGIIAGVCITYIALNRKLKVSGL